MENLSNLFVFIHIPKNAGSSVNKILSHVYKDALFNGLKIRADKVVETVKYLNAEEKEKIKAFTSHDRYKTAKYLFPNRKIILTGLLREPVSRLVSYIKYVKQTPTHRHYLATKELSLDESLKYFISINEGEISNDQCRYLGDCSSFEMAKSSIINNFSIVGTVDNFDEFVLACSNKLGWDIAQLNIYKKQNESKKVPGEKPSDWFLHQAIELNTEDKKLYEYVYSHPKGIVFGSGIQNII